MQIPTVLAFAAALRQRGAQFSGLSFSGNDIGGATGVLYPYYHYNLILTPLPTVWSMPGGFTSGGREGYQSVEDPVVSPSPKPLSHPPTAPQSQTTVPGAYQSV